VKTKLLMLVVLIAGLAASVRPSFAHHGAAAFDMTKPVVLKNATITEFLWINPHPLIKADYKDEKGEVQHWTMEMGSTVSAQLSAGPERRWLTETSSRCTSGRPKRSCRLDVSTRSNSPTGTVMRDTQTGADDGGRAGHRRSPVSTERRRKRWFNHEWSRRRTKWDHNIDSRDLRGTS
jgi:hypothetical protein